MTKTKQCPFCAEDIKLNAIFCRFCSHDLPLEINSDPSKSTASETNDSEHSKPASPTNAEPSNKTETACSKEAEYPGHPTMIFAGIILLLIIWGVIKLLTAIGWGWIFGILAVLIFFFVPFLRKTGGLLLVILGILSCFMSILGIGIILGIPMIVIGGILLFM